MRKIIPGSWFLLLAYGLLLAIPAYAYIDPNATGLLSQIVAPLLMIVATVFTFFRKQVRAVMGRLTGRGVPKE